MCVPARAPHFSEACGANLHQNQAGPCFMDASLRSQGQAEVNSSVQVASPPWAFLAQIRPKVRLLAVGFNGQIRKATPFSFDSAHGGEIAIGLGLGANAALIELDISNNSTKQGFALQRITELCNTKSTEV